MSFDDFNYSKVNDSIFNGVVSTEKSDFDDEEIITSITSEEESKLNELTFEE